MPDEADPFAAPTPSSAGPAFKADFDVDTKSVSKLAGAMGDLSKQTDKVEGSFAKLSKRGQDLQRDIQSILRGGGLSTGGAGGGGSGNGGNPSVPQTGGGGGGRRGGIFGRGGGDTSGIGPIVTADFGLDLMRYLGNIRLPGYNRMQSQLQSGLPLDAYATQWSAAYGRPPSQIPNRIINGGALGTPAQVAGAAQFGASIGAIPGVTQQGGAYWSSVNQLQRMAPGMGPEGASQLAGGLLSPQVNTAIAQRYGVGAAPIGQGGTLKPFNVVAADILKALRRRDQPAGTLPTREMILAGLLPGSRMRQQMRVAMGLDDDTITMILNWGLNNASYQARGGTGVYDPSDPTQRRLATGSGARDSLSNYVQTYQAAKTGTTANFLQGQYGSMQDMVQTQTTLTEVMSKVDDAFTSIYSVVGPAGPVLTGLLGFAGHIGSAIIALDAFSVALGRNSGVGGIAGAAGGAGRGPGGIGTVASGLAFAGGVLLANQIGKSGLVQNAPDIAAPLGGKPAPGSAAGSSFMDVLSHPSRLYDPRNWFGDLPIGDPVNDGMSGDFKRKLGSMMAANPNLVMTSGYRSASQQGVGQRAGVGRMGSAGDSWHVRGKAADLGPASQYGWIAKNAQKFGLDTGHRFGEPWHVQDRGTAGKRPPMNLFINQSARGAGGAYRGARGAVGDLPGLSISSLLASSLALNVGSLFASPTTQTPGSSDQQSGTSPAAGGGGQVDKVIAYAMAQLGKPYVFAKQGPDAFDCSGLVTAAYRQVGIELPALTFSQVKKGSAVPIDPAAARPGDLLFARGGSPAMDFGHVGIYLGAGQKIHAPKTGDVVKISSVDWGSIQAIRRIIGASSTAAAAPSTGGSWDDFLNAHMETSGKLDPGATMSGPQIAAAFYRAGFRGQPLTDMVAISGRESGWNPTAFNFHAKSTGDVSLGLTQINVKDSMMNRLKEYGLTDPRQLLEAGNAAHASFVLSSGGTNLSPWGGYKGMSNTYGTNMQSATNAVSEARQQGLIGDLPIGGGGSGGDAGSSTMPGMSGYSGTTFVASGGRGGSPVNITNHFHINGNGDAQSQGLRVAQVAVQAMRDQMAREAMRSA